MKARESTPYEYGAERTCVLSGNTESLFHRKALCSFCPAKVESSVLCLWTVSCAGSLDVAVLCTTFSGSFLGMGVIVEGFITPFACRSFFHPHDGAKKKHDVSILCGSGPSHAKSMVSAP